MEGGSGGMRAIRVKCNRALKYGGLYIPCEHPALHKRGLHVCLYLVEESIVNVRSGDNNVIESYRYRKTLNMVKSRHKDRAIHFTRATETWSLSRPNTRAEV